MLLRYSPGNAVAVVLCFDRRTTCLDATRFDSLVNVEKKLKQTEHDILSVTAHKFLIDIIRLRSRNIIESTDRLKCGPMAPNFQLLE